MKKILYIVLLLLAVSCKPSETNYRKAYETARRHTDSTGIIEGTIYESIRNRGTSGGIITKSGDTIPMITIPVKLATELSVPTRLTKYNIGCAQFKQRSNALSLMNRLHDLGHTETTIVRNAEPLYYVIVPGASTTDEAVALFESTLPSFESISVRSPYPMIICPSGY